jgi:tripartite-type tricarboxylate transporter receptor subunit TctC
LPKSGLRSAAHCSICIQEGQQFLVENRPGASSNIATANAALADAAFKAQLAKLGLGPFASTPTEFAKFIAAEPETKFIAAEP